jgi:flagellar biosynthesis/type III secretory pathway protein FliH
MWETGASLPPGELVRAGRAEQVAERLVERSRDVLQRRADLPDVIELARALAERALGRALEVSDAALGGWAVQLLDEARGARMLRLVTHPLELERLRIALPAALAPLELHELDLQLLADPTLPRFGLRLETELGVLEASVPATLDALARCLR